MRLARSSLAKVKANRSRSISWPASMSTFSAWWICDLM